VENSHQLNGLLIRQKSSERKKKSSTPTQKNQKQAETYFYFVFNKKPRQMECWNYFIWLKQC